MLYFNTTQLSAFWFSVARTTGNPVYASRKHLVKQKLRQASKILDQIQFEKEACLITSKQSEFLYF